MKIRKFFKSVQVNNHLENGELKPSNKRKSRKFINTIMLENIIDILEILITKAIDKGILKEEDIKDLLDEDIEK